MLQQEPPPARTDAGQIVEHRAQTLASTQLAVKRDREAMRFIPDALHAVAPVAALVGLPLVEHHHRADDLPALEVRDVEALDALRRVAETELLPELLDHLRALVVDVAAGAERLTRVLRGHLAEAH